MKLIIHLFIALFLSSACVTVPKIDGGMKAKLDQLEAANKPFKEIKNPILAGALNIIPGVGQMYAGDVEDGIKVMFMFWTFYHYVMGFVDAVNEARHANATYTIQYWTKQNFKFSLFRHNTPSKYKLFYEVRPNYENGYSLDLARL